MVGGLSEVRRPSVLGLIVLLAFGCGRGDAPPEAIRIGVVANLAGSSEPTREAAELALNEINAAGGLEVEGRRRPVELLFEDTLQKPDVASTGVRKLVQQGVVAIIGPNRSRDAISAGGVAEYARVPMISPSSTHPQTTAGRRYVFRVSFTDSLLGQALGRFARQDLGAGTAAVLFDIASAYNRDLAAVFRQAFEAAGGRLVAFESYTTGDTDFDRQLERIHDSRPQVLFLPNYFEEIPAQARQARELGIDATLLGGDSWNLLSFADLPLLDGAFFAQHWHVAEAETKHETERFVAAYRQAYGREPVDHAALVYDAVGLLFHAIALAGDDPDGIRNTLADVDGYRGVTGEITYRDAGGDPMKRLLIGRVQQGEAVIFKVVEPPRR